MIALALAPGRMRLTHLHRRLPGVSTGVLERYVQQMVALGLVVPHALQGDAAARRARADRRGARAAAGRGSARAVGDAPPVVAAAGARAGRRRRPAALLPVLLEEQSRPARRVRRGARRRTPIRPFVASTGCRTAACGWTTAQTTRPPPRTTRPRLPMLSIRPIGAASVQGDERRVDRRARTCRRLSAAALRRRCSGSPGASSTRSPGADRPPGFATMRLRDRQGRDPQGAGGRDRPRAAPLDRRARHGALDRAQPQRGDRRDRLADHARLPDQGPLPGRRRPGGLGRSRA